MLRSTALRDFLRGAWRLRKEIDYRVGGGAAEFVGRATWTEEKEEKEEEGEEEEAGLRYEEKGHMSLATGVQTETNKTLLYTFPGPRQARIFFLDGEGEGTGEGTRRRHFHDLRFAGEEENMCSFEHWCDPDMYRGSLTIMSEAEFHVEWQVTGPRKDGSILAVYTREPA